MTCPDWRALAARRASGEEPIEWPQALDHLDGCPDCRHAAPLADPVLLFRRLPTVELAAEEVEEMRLRVQVLRRGRRFEPLLRSRRVTVQRAAAMIALLGGLTLLGGHSGLGSRPGGEPFLASDPWPYLAATSLTEDEIAQPLLEEIDQPFDQVVQWSGEDFSMVLVVDQRLDV